MGGEQACLSFCLYTSIPSISLAEQGAWQPTPLPSGLDFRFCMIKINSCMTFLLVIYTFLKSCNPSTPLRCGGGRGVTPLHSVWVTTIEQTTISDMSKSSKCNKKFPGQPNLFRSHFLFFHQTIYTGIEINVAVILGYFQEKSIIEIIKILREMVQS